MNFYSSDMASSLVHSFASLQPQTYNFRLSTAAGSEVSNTISDIATEFMGQVIPIIVQKVHEKGIMGHHYDDNAAAHVDFKEMAGRKGPTVL